MLPEGLCPAAALGAHSLGAGRQETSQQINTQEYPRAGGNEGCDQRGVRVGQGGQTD